MKKKIIKSNQTYWERKKNNLQNFSLPLKGERTNPLCKTKNEIKKQKRLWIKETRVSNKRNYELLKTTRVVCFFLSALSTLARHNTENVNCVLLAGILNDLDRLLRWTDIHRDDSIKHSVGIFFIILVV